MTLRLQWWAPINLVGTCTPPHGGKPTGCCSLWVHSQAEILVLVNVSFLWLVRTAFLHRSLGYLPSYIASHHQDHHILSNWNRGWGYNPNNKHKNKKSRWSVLSKWQCWVRLQAWCKPRLAARSLEPHIVWGVGQQHAPKIEHDHWLRKLA
jgi:hypothetical protein